MNSPADGHTPRQFTPPQVVSASAGTGKTHRLTGEVVAAIQPEAEHPIDLEGLVAVTYTTKAEAELSARIRGTLVQAGAYDRAQLLPLAYLGTVHATCLRLLQENALEAGLSPTVAVMTDSGTQVLREAIENELDPELTRELNQLAGHLGIEKDNTTDRSDWHVPAYNIMTVARANRMSPDQLKAMGPRAAEGVVALLPPPSSDGDAMNRELRSTLESVLARVDVSELKTKKAVQTIEKLNRTLRAMKTARGLPWSEWAILSELDSGKELVEAVKPIVEAAENYERHPHLRSDLATFTVAIYAAAARALDHYAAWKQSHRLVDYVDMIDRCIDLLDNESIAAELATRLDLAVVDEFQDTNPAQLALFLRLHALAGRSVWVGDRKQCIFEFSGADPELMDSVVTWASELGGTPERLPCNWRSRPELVDACSTLFTKAFGNHGFAPEEVRVTANRTTPPGLAALPPLALWELQGTRRGQHAQGIARGIHKILQNPNETPVVDRVTGEVRGARAGDIAVLVFTNGDAANVAAALHPYGVSVALARPRLLETAEGTLVESALSYLLDERDTRAGAIVEALLGYENSSPDEWLAARIRHCGADDSAAGESATSTWAPALAAIRGRLSVLSPAEVMDQCLSALDASHICARWSEPEQRLGNLDALRALARRYEEECTQRHEAATLAGLLRFFGEVGRPGRPGEEPTDAQHYAASENAVTVSTYHRAKGLEWPVVVLGGLDSKSVRSPIFDVAPESEEGHPFDPERPLEGRWIRYWPWPFGGKRRVPLADRADRSEVGKRVLARNERELLRLLYVGFTRARDHLVIAAAANKTKLKLDRFSALRDEDHNALLELPHHLESPEADAVTRVRGPGDEVLSVPTRYWQLEPGGPATDAQADAPSWFERGARELSPPLPYRIAPSSAAVSESRQFKTGEAVRIGPAIQLGSRERDWARMGTALHGFLAADTSGLTADERERRAERMIVAAELSGEVDAAVLMRGSDALTEFVESRWPGATWHREVPVSVRLGEVDGGENTSGDADGRARCLSGAIDLLLETANGYVIIDHKSFPAPSEPACRGEAKRYAHQLDAYATALRAAGHDVLGGWVHFTVAGMFVEVVEVGAVAGLGELR